MNKNKAPRINQLERRHDEELGTNVEHARSHEVRLGNPELPIYEYRDKIVDAVDRAQATVITAETGAGKSTQVPQFLAEEGYKVVVTQPRRIAARGVSERVGEEITEKAGDEFKNFVGYKISGEGNTHRDNRIVFATDGLQLVRELSGDGVGEKQVLVLDEVHEWNTNMEVLVAWAKKRVEEDENFKVVTMSATMEAERLSNYFSDGGKREAPVIEVPGRTFEVTKREGGEVVSETVQFAREGKNTLVFVPGKAEIDSVMSKIDEARLSGVRVLPLHGQMEKSQQDLIHKKYDGTKVIVATNVAQTSITIDGIDAVVDSGLERQSKVKNGVDGLYLSPISQADCMQRAGRAGRTKEGDYVLARLGSIGEGYPFKSLEKRSEYGTPEILRTRLDGTVLRLASAGMNAAEMDFYNQPDSSEIVGAKKRLEKLGALSKDGSLTEIGRAMEKLPVESNYARMMIEARKYSPEVRMQLIAALAVQEAGGICMHPKGSFAPKWMNMIDGDKIDSDVLTQLEVFIQAQEMSGKERKENDISNKGFSKANTIMRQLRRAENLRDQDLTEPDEEQYKQLMRCIVAGMVDNLYTKSNSYGYFKDTDGNLREASNRSLADTSGYYRDSDEEVMIVGKPFDLEIQTKRGKKTLHLLENITVVPSVETLHEVAPQLFERANEAYDLRTVDGALVAHKSYDDKFDGRKVSRSSEPVPAGPERQVAYAYIMLNNQEIRKALFGELEGKLNDTLDLTDKFTHDDFGMDENGKINDELLMAYLAEAIPQNAANLNDVLNSELKINLSFADFITEEELAEVKKSSPSEYNGLPLLYEDGKPQLIDSNMGDKIVGDILNFPVKYQTLPDGRDIYYLGISLRERYEYETKKLAHEKAEREARERAAEARQREIEARRRETRLAEQRARKEEERIAREEAEAERQRRVAAQLEAERKARTEAKRKAKANANINKAQAEAERNRSHKAAIAKREKIIKERMAGEYGKQLEDRLRQVIRSDSQLTDKYQPMFNWQFGNLVSSKGILIKRPYGTVDELRPIGEDSQNGAVYVLEGNKKRAHEADRYQLDGGMLQILSHNRAGSWENHMRWVEADMIDQIDKEARERGGLEDKLEVGPEVTEPITVDEDKIALDAIKDQLLSKWTS